jgi:hypothetical protein
MARHAAAAVVEAIGSRQPWKERQREKSRGVRSEEIEVDADDAIAGIVEAIAIVSPVPNREHRREPRSIQPRIALPPRPSKLLRMETSRARLRASEKELPERMAAAGGGDVVDAVVGVAVNRPVMQT